MFQPTLTIHGLTLIGWWRAKSEAFQTLQLGMCCLWFLGHDVPCSVRTACRVTPSVPGQQLCHGKRTLMTGPTCLRVNILLASLQAASWPSRSARSSSPATPP